MQQGLDQRIRQRAYEIWEALGRPDGDSNQHWLTAERRKKLVRLPRKRRPRTKALAKRNSPVLARGRWLWAERPGRQHQHLS